MQHFRLISKSESHTQIPAQQDFEQEIQSQCDVFRNRETEQTDGTYNRALSQKTKTIIHEVSAFSEELKPIASVN